MKRNILVFLMSAFIFFAGVNIARAQEQPAPKKDTVNMDTYAKPEFYNAEEDAPAKGGSYLSAILMVGAVLLIGATAYLLLKKKK